MMYNELKRLKIDRYVWMCKMRVELQPLVPDLGAISILCLREHKRTLSVRIFNTSGDLVAKFQLSFFPGCKGILVSHALEVSESYRKRGIASTLMNTKLWMARELQVNMLMATIVITNDLQMKVMQRHHWNYAECFTNKRTGNTIRIMVKHL